MGKLRQQMGQTSRKVTEPGFQPKHFDWAFMPLNTWWPCLERNQVGRFLSPTCQGCSAVGKGWGTYCSLPNCSPHSPALFLLSCAPAQVRTGGNQAVKLPIVYLKGKRNIYHVSQEAAFSGRREKIKMKNTASVSWCFCFVFILGLDHH